MNACADIVALGACTPLGYTAESAAAAVRGRISQVSGHPFMVDAAGDPITGAFNPKLPADIPAPERMQRMAKWALQDALRRIDLSSCSPLPVLLALPETRPGFSDEHAQNITQSLGDVVMSDSRNGRDIELRLELAARGHAGTLRAIHMSIERMARGEFEACAVCGTDSYFDADTIDWLSEHRRLVGVDIRNGFAIGEAAGAILLVSDRLRNRLGVPSCGKAHRPGISVEQVCIQDNEDSLGIGLSDAVGEAVGSAGAALRLPEQAIDIAYCDVNGERYRSEEWGFAVLRNPHAFKDSAYITATESWGDVGAASGVLNCILASRAWSRGYAQGPRAMIWGSSEAGERAALVLEQPSSGHQKGN